MKIDLSRLQNVRHLAGGKTTARCPACAADGGDTKGDHLAVFRDGKFGCVAQPKDKAHNRTILELAGAEDGGGGGSGCRLTVKPFRVEESRVLMKIGRVKRVPPGPPPEAPRPSPLGGAAAESVEVADGGPERPADLPPLPGGPAISEVQALDMMDEELRAFLGSPLLAA